MPASSVANTSRTRERELSRVSYRKPEEPYKRLIVAEDGKSYSHKKRLSSHVASKMLTRWVKTGTWLNSDSGSIKNAINIPSNVTRLSRAIKPQSSDGIQQIVYYHRGVGSSSGLVDRVYGGITGEGMPLSHSQLSCPFFLAL